MKKSELSDSLVKVSILKFCDTDYRPMVFENGTPSMGTAIVDIGIADGFKDGCDDISGAVVHWGFKPF